MNLENKIKPKSEKLRYLVVMPRLVQNIGDGYSFPLGIPYISATMKRAGHEVYTLNLNHREGNISEIIGNEIENNKIDVIATGGLSFQYTTIKEVIDSAKRADKNIVTIVGGGIISGDPEPAMSALEYVNYGVIGEGEATIQELCNLLENGGDINQINGLIYNPNKNNFIKTFPRGDIKNLDSLPWPDYEGFELDKYLKASPSISGLNRQNTIFMIASRSCPYSCTFCFHTVGKTYRQRSLDNFFKEVDFMKSKYNIDYICLADELFSVNPERVKEFCRRIKPYNVKWWAQFRAKHITKNPELLPLLKDSGLNVMSVGLESADDRILKSMKKKTTMKDAEDALKLLYDEGMSFEGSFIFGDSEETWDTASNTLKWWKEHPEYKITLNLITIYPGTPLYHEGFARGLIKDKVQFLREGCPQVNVSKLNDDEIALLMREIVEAPMTLTKKLLDSDATILEDRTGRIQLTGKCSSCGREDRWDGVKLFSSSFIACNHCGQRYNLVLPNKLRSSLDNNLSQLLEHYKQIAVWGVNYHVADLFKHSEILRGPNIIPIEISEVKRKMDLYGKRPLSPEVIDKNNIQAVIVSIPAYINEITRKINTNHKTVKETIDLCQLVNPNYFNLGNKNGNK